MFWFCYFCLTLDLIRSLDFSKPLMPHLQNGPWGFVETKGYHVGQRTLSTWRPLRNPYVLTIIFKLKYSSVFFFHCSQQTVTIIPGVGDQAQEVPKVLFLLWGKNGNNWAMLVHPKPNIYIWHIWQAYWTMKLMMATIFLWVNDAYC